MASMEPISFFQNFSWKVHRIIENTKVLDQSQIHVTCQHEVVLTCSAVVSSCSEGFCFRSGADIAGSSLLPNLLCKDEAQQ